MADKWVSTGKRYCEICKVWFGNNKASQDHHDRGDRHKAMLANRIRESMQKGKRQEIADLKLNGTLARMEAAAAASMARHGEGVMQGPGLPATGLRMNIFDPRQHKDFKSIAEEMSSRRDGINLKRGLSGASGPVTGLGAPSLKNTKEDIVSAYRDLTNPSAHGPALPESHAVQYLPQAQCTEIQWVQAKSEEGTYYWNIFDNTTRWDQPAFFYTEQEYEKKVQEFEESRARNYYGLDDVKAVKQGKRDVEQYIKAQITQAGLAEQIEANRKEMQFVDRTDKGKKAEKRRKWEEKKRQEEEAVQKLEYELKIENQIPKEAGETFNNEPSSSSFFASMLISPPPPPPLPLPKKEIKEEIAETEYTEEIEEKEPEQETVKLNDNIIAYSSAAPLGNWIRVKKEEQSDVPFVSPLTARYKEEEEREKLEVEKREKDEPKIEFGEKKATIMTKKIKGPIEFKKKTTTRSIRKREE